MLYFYFPGHYWPCERTQDRRSVSSAVYGFLPKYNFLTFKTFIFTGFWRNKFNASFTGPDVFHLDHELVVPVEMMKAHQYPLSWFTLESQDIQVGISQEHCKFSLEFPLAVVFY